MHCFYHPKKAAIGTCKSCGKGLCAECAVDLDKGLACKQHCEPEVKSLIRYSDRIVHHRSLGEKIGSWSSYGNRTVGAWYYAIGFLTIGVVACLTIILPPNPYFFILTVAGLVLVVLGIAMFRNATAAEKSEV